ncbi:regulator [Mordavella massiliensis]|nr:regulator [Mordavella massiliensis]
MKIITTDKIAASNGPYSQGYTHNGFFFTAGQIGVEPSDGELHVHTIEAQTDRACRNIGIMLEAAGTSFDKVIKANCFIADMDDFDAFNQVYAKYFISKPARTCVAVKTLPKHALCEIEVIAAL